MTTWGKHIGDVAVRALLHRISMAVSVNVIILFAEATQPVETVNAHLRHLTAELAAAKRGLALMLADATLLQRQLAQRQAKVADWQARAEFALRAGDASLARQALARKLHVQRIAEQYADAYTAQQHSLAQVYAAVGHLEDRIRKVRSVRAQFQVLPQAPVGTVAWRRVEQLGHTAPRVWQNQETVEAQWEQFELDQAMVALRRTVQG